MWFMAHRAAARKYRPLKHWLDDSPTRTDYFIQEYPRDVWHVESRGHCEYMLCGKFISVDAAQVRIQQRWGPKKCFDCYVIYKRREQDAPEPDRPTSWREASRQMLAFKGFV